MPIPSKLDRDTERVLEDDGIEKQKLQQVFGVRLSSSETREIWPQVLKHKWYLSERCGRDVGIRAAALDYFENVRRVRKREEVRNTLPPALAFMRPFGYR